MQYTVSPFFRIPTVTTIHDVSYLVNPAWFALQDRILLRGSIPGSTRRASRVIAVSEVGRTEIVNHLGILREKVHVTPLGAPTAPPDLFNSREFMVQNWQLENYVLNVGGLQPRKNWKLAIDAVRCARNETGGDMKLAITGPMRERSQTVAEFIRRREGERWVRLTGPMPASDLPYAYSGSVALVHTSLYEGFGLTPLEAFAFGTPVIASTGGALPEVVGDAGILLPPADPDLWGHAISRLWEDECEREALIEKGHLQCKSFSWDETARKTELCYFEAMQPN
jgi:glycosyltransferase involved in cell wall biosynthesis